MATASPDSFLKCAFNKLMTSLEFCWGNLAGTTQTFTVVSLGIENRIEVLIPIVGKQKLFPEGFPQTNTTSGDPSKVINNPVATGISPSGEYSRGFSDSFEQEIKIRLNIKKMIWMGCIFFVFIFFPKIKEIILVIQITYKNKKKFTIKTYGLFHSIQISNSLFIVFQ
jgi:hypothetical protein